MLYTILSTYLSMSCALFLCADHGTAVWAIDRGIIIVDLPLV